MKAYVRGGFLAGVMCLSVSAVSATENDIYDWSGTYIGVDVGYGWSKADFSDTEYNGSGGVFPPVYWDVKSDRIMAAGQLGYNRQYGSTVVGLEGEIGYLNFDGARLQPGTDLLGDPYDASGVFEGGWYLGLGARLGYALDRTLLYLKAGGVYSTADMRVVDRCVIAPCGVGTLNATGEVGWGYQLGAGAEHALDENWIVKAHYTYFDFGSTDINGIGVGGPFQGVPYHLSADLVVQMVRMGINYKF